MLPISIKLYKNILMKLSKKGAFYILAGNFLTKFAVFFGSIFLVRTLSKSSYGILGYIENIYGYIYIFAGMGLANAILRYVVLAESPSDEYSYYNYVQKKGTIYNIILVLVVGLCGIFYPHPEEFKSARWLLIIVLLAVPFQSYVDISLYTYRAKFANKRYAITAVVVSVMLVAINYIGALLWELNGVIATKVIVYAFSGIILCIVTHKLYFRGYHLNALIKSDRRIIDKYSIQYMITNGIWTIFMLNDIFLLSILGGEPSAIADYKVAYVLPGNLSIISGAIGIFVAPYFVKHESDHEWVMRKYKTVMGITSGVLGVVTIILFIFAKPVIILLYGSQYENTVIIMRLLLIAAFANSGIRFTTANLLAAMGEIKYNMIIAFSGVILQIAINILMIPHYGLIGVAWTSIVIYTIMALTLLIIFSRRYAN